uniref:WH2 domain-containing protein n=1 Tax=Romanomermis culicivorax TaxID=13658 RepID=A0A915HXM2_ROMCU
MSDKTVRYKNLIFMRSKLLCIFTAGTSKPETARPLPPTPGSKSSTSPAFKGQAPSPPQNSSTNQQIEQQHHLRTLTATGAEITEPSKTIRSIKDQLMSVGGSLGGVTSAAPAPPPPLSSPQPKNVSRASAVLANVSRPPPPSKPPHLISSGDQQVPPPPPSKPPSQKPPLDEVKTRRPDFRTIRPQRPGSSGAKGVSSSVHRSNSEENIHQSPTNQISPLTPNSRPAPPPPPQRPPPLPPALNRPSGAPPPPPLPKNSPVEQPKRPQIMNGSA